MKKDSKQQQLQASIKAGVLTISIGIDTLAYAYENSDYASDAGLKVTKKAQFAKDVLSELLNEEEDGTTLVHHLLDDAANRAVENGSDSVHADAEEDL